MKTKLVRAFALVVGLLVVSGSMLAHHGNSAYDTDHPITITGTVTDKTGTPVFDARVKLISTGEPRDSLWHRPPSFARSKLS